VIKGNKAPAVVASASQLQKKWIDQVTEPKGDGKRKREEGTAEEPPAQKRKVEGTTKTPIKMEKAVRSAAPATPPVVQSPKPTATKSEKTSEKALPPSPEGSPVKNNVNCSPKEEKIVKEEQFKEEIKEAPRQIPTPVSDFQGSSSDKKRNRIQQRLWEALGTCQVQGGTESSMVAASIEEAMWREFGKDEKKYQAKFRSLFSNLKDELNQGLRNALFTGALESTRLIQMSHEELANPKLQEERKKLKELQIAARQDYKLTASCTLFNCFKCGKNETTYFQLQTRSADEPMTTFVTCVACGNHWKF